MRFDFFKEKLNSKVFRISAAAAAFFVVAAFVLAGRSVQQAHPTPETVPETVTEAASEAETETETETETASEMDEETAIRRELMYSRKASSLKDFSEEEEEEFVPAANKLNMAFFFPDDADTSDSIHSYAGEIFTDLITMNADYFASYYDLTDRTPLSMAQSRGLGADRVMGRYNPEDSSHDEANPASWIINRFKNVNVSFYNGDGSRISGSYIVKEILAMASVYAYYHDMDDADAMREYCSALFKKAMSAKVSLGNVYYDSGCLNRSIEDEAAEAIALEEAQMALELGLENGALPDAVSMDGTGYGDGVVISDGTVIPNYGYAVVGENGTVSNETRLSTNAETTHADDNVITDPADQPLTEESTSESHEIESIEDDALPVESSEPAAAGQTAAESAESSEKAPEETTAAETTAGEAIAGETAPLETSAPETAAPEIISEETSAPETAAPAADSAEPTVSETPAPAAAPEESVEYIDDAPLDISLISWIPKAYALEKPFSFLAEADAVPAENIAETVTEAHVSETPAPESIIPETTAPETSMPETSVPETSAPEASVPETTAPETSGPETTDPGTTLPESTAPTYHAIDSNGHPVEVYGNGQAVTDEISIEPADNGAEETAAPDDAVESKETDENNSEDIQEGGNGDGGESTGAAETESAGDPDNAEDAENAENAEEDKDEKNYCPGHIDLFVSITIRGVKEKNGLFKVDDIGNDKANFNENWEGWTKEHIEEVRDLCEQDWFENYGLSISSIKLSSSLTEEEIQHYLDTLPASVSADRKAVVDFALHSVGKVPYYWGGKPAGAGYANNHFNVLTSPDTRGRILTGLDCSGWVSWVYWSATGSPPAGQSTGSLIGCGRRISRSALQPGDIIIRTGEDAHVVMFLCWAGNGNLIGIHETGGAVNNVVVREMTASWPYYRALLD